MPNINTEVPNPLGKEEAIERLKNFAGRIQEQFKDQVSDMEHSWGGDTLNYSFKTYGFKIKGELTVEEERVQLRSDLPLAALAFRKKIEESISSELVKALS